jgi:hypothetical protein
MGTLFWIFAIATLLLQVGIEKIVKRYGPGVDARFAERPKKFQPEGVPTKPLKADCLTRWINDNAKEAGDYACPVLFPLDFIFMVALTGTLGFGSVCAASHFASVSDVSPWVWWVFPLIYLMADFVEDVLLFRCLRNAGRVERSFVALSRATAVKMLSVGLAITQFVLLALLQVCY